MPSANHLGTRQRGSFAECLLLTLGKLYFFSHLTFKLFLQSSYNIWYSMFQCGTFLGLFLHFFNLFHLIKFSWIIQIITASHSNNEKMNGKMIFMLFSIMWGRIQKQTTNFEHLVYETRPWTCGRVVFKFYKKANEVQKSWNLSRCHDIICGRCDKKLRRFCASCHVRCLPPRRPLHEIIKLLRRFFGLQALYVTTCAKHSQFLSQPPHMISWHLDKFHDFRTSFAFYRI